MALGSDAAANIMAQHRKGRLVSCAGSVGEQGKGKPGRLIRAG